MTPQSSREVSQRPLSGHTGWVHAWRTLAATCLTALLICTGIQVAGADPSVPDHRTALERDDTANLLAVVTKQRPIHPLDYAPEDLVTWPHTDFELRAEVADQLELMFTAAADDGLAYRVVSGYRSYDTQAGTYEYWARQSGTASADAVSARPGHSEHQTGLAVDLDNTTGECYLKMCFGETTEGRWVAEHAHEFGFVISYPEGTRDITGYAYEPWHIRYVGPQVAGDMNRRGYLLISTYLAPPASSVRLGELLGSHG
nr:MULTISPECIES: M15 family metallopeptidase [unclassified Ornithinimicrobium]